MATKQVPPNTEKRNVIKTEERMVFSGSSIEDVNHAKSFWKTLTLQPPLESRLVSADIRQRLRVATVPDKPKPKPMSSWEEAKTAVFLHNAYEQKKKEERDANQELALKREEALNLLQKQRMERLQKEMISLPYKPLPKAVPDNVSEDYIVDDL